MLSRHGRESFKKIIDRFAGLRGFIDEIVSRRNARNVKRIDQANGLIVESRQWQN